MGSKGLEKIDLDIPVKLVKSTGSPPFKSIRSLVSLNEIMFSNQALFRSLFEVLYP